MSLILDALKKLEREKDAREPNVLVVGSVAWGARGRSRRPLVVALLGTALVALVAFALWPRERPDRPATAPSPAVPTPAPPAVREAPSPKSPAPSTAEPAPEPRLLSVPPSGPAAAEAPPPAPAPAADDLRLNAISQRDGKPVALINDRLVFEGDGFDGVKVLRIGEAEVEVEVRGRRQVLRF